MHDKIRGTFIEREHDLVIHPIEYTAGLFNKTQADVKKQVFIIMTALNDVSMIFNLSSEGDMVLLKENAI